MKYAVIARPPVVGGKVKSVNDQAARAVAGVEDVVQIEGSIPPAKFAPLGGVAVIASNTYAAIAGPRGPRDRVGRRPARRLRQRAVPQGDVGDRRKAGQGDPQPGRRRCRSRQCGQDLQRRVLPAAHGAHLHGAAGGAGPRPRRPGGDLGLRPEPLRHPPGRGREARHADRERDRQRHAARRRLRPQVQMRLCARGGDPVAADRRAGPGAVDARGRHPALLLPHHLGRADRGGDRRQRQGHRLAAPQRGAVDPLDLRRRLGPSVPDRVRHGLRRHAVRHPEHPGRERQGDGAYPDRLVPVGLERAARLRGAVLRGRARQRAGSRSEGFSARADRRAAGDRAGSRRASPTTTGTTASPMPSFRSTPRACGA